MELNQFLNCDCMEYMATVPDKYFELVIVDPPYGIGDFTQSDAIHHNVKWNNKKPDKNYFDELKRISKKRIIWGANYYNCFEDGNGALVWWKNVGHHSMSQCEIASISGQQKIDYYHKNWSGGVRHHITIHPCQKPIQLYQYLLMNYAKKGDKIFDSHAGSCSSRIACWEEGFDWVGCELDPDYYKAAELRYQEHIKQQKLFND
jgi:site-specific DNA-methyltransferase (adenine-specific)